MLSKGEGGYPPVRRVDEAYGPTIQFIGLIDLLPSHQSDHVNGFGDLYNTVPSRFKNLITNALTTEQSLRGQ